MKVSVEIYKDMDGEEVYIMMEDGIQENINMEFSMEKVNMSLKILFQKESGFMDSLLIKLIEILTVQ